MFVEVLLGPKKRAPLVFPVAFLRDNSPSNFHPTTLQRLVPASRTLSARAGAPTGTGSAAVSVTAHGDLQLSYNTSASTLESSIFTAAWLEARALRPEAAARRRGTAKRLRELEPWTPAILRGGNNTGTGTGRCGGKESARSSTHSRAAGTWPSELLFSYDAVLADDTVCLQWLQRLWGRGLTVLRGAPRGRTGAVEALGRRLGFLRATNYGATFDVKDKPAPENQAYTSAALPMHTDLPFYAHPPGIQLLHCVRPAPPGPAGRGGESLFVDGLAAGAALRTRQPEHFDTLASHRAVFVDDAPARYHMRAAHPVLQMDNEDEGVLVGVNYNEGVRASYADDLVNAGSGGLAHEPEPEEAVAAFYGALSALGAIFEEPGMVLEARLEAGDVAVFNNRRVLHGRRAYTSTSTPTSAPTGDPQAEEEGGQGRYLQGGYVDWDEVHSFYRVLAERTGRSDLVEGLLMAPSAGRGGL